MSKHINIDWNQYDKQIASGMKKKDIAKLLGITPQRLSIRIRERDITTNTPAIRNEAQALEEYKENRADILAQVQKDILSTVTVDEIKKATPYQRVGMFGILYDKERLERGESTNNVSVMARVVSGAEDGIDGNTLRSARRNKANAV